MASVEVGGQNIKTQGDVDCNEEGDQFLLGKQQSTKRSVTSSTTVVEDARRR